MNPRQILERLEGVETDMLWHLPEMTIKVGKEDAIAAKLIAWLEEQLPEDATLHTYLEILNSAIWYFTLFGTMYSAELMQGKVTTGSSHTADR